MINRCINDLPINILKECCNLKEITMFVLPDIFMFKGKYINNWKNILILNLNKIFRRHKKTLNITLRIYNINTNKIKEDILTIDVSRLLDFILELLIKDMVIFITINNYNYPYGYLIIPGKQIK